MQLPIAVAAAGVQQSGLRSVNLSALLRVQRPGHAAKSWRSRAQWMHRDTHSRQLCVRPPRHASNASDIQEVHHSVGSQLVAGMHGCGAQRHKGLLPLNCRHQAVLPNLLQRVPGATLAPTCTATGSLLPDRGSLAPQLQPCPVLPCHPSHAGWHAVFAQIALLPSPPHL
jgi:hypothetical protein